MKVSLYGPYPPNIGGVSIHIQRLAEKLKKKNVLKNVYVNNFTSIIDFEYTSPYVNLSDSSRFNLCKRIKTVICMAKSDTSLYHLHGSIIWDYFIIFCLTIIYKKNILFTLHDHIQLSKNRLILSVIKFFYKFIPDSKLYFIAVNSKIKQQLEFIGIDSSSIRIIPAFIKEDNNDELDKNLTDALNENSIKILLYAPSLMTRENFEIYGIYDAIFSVAQLMRIERYKKIKLFLCVPTGINKNIYRPLCNKSKIKDTDIYLYDKPIGNMNKLLEFTDIYLRPTLTDGDSLLVREALANRCIVLASDAVNRPQSTILYKTRERNDLINRLHEIICNMSTYKEQLCQGDDYFEEVFDFYNLILKK